MNQLTPSFTTGDAAYATKLDSVALDRWLASNTFQLDAVDTGARGSGHPRGWSIRTVKRLAVMVELTKFGITPRRAERISSTAMSKLEHYTHSDPTYLLIAPSDTMRVLHPAAAHFEDVLEDAIQGGSASLIIDVARLFRRVDDRLAAVAKYTEAN